MSSTAREHAQRLASTPGWPTVRPEWLALVADAVDAARVAPRDRDAALARASVDCDFNVCALGGDLSAPRDVEKGARRRGRFIVQLDEWSDAASDARTRHSDARCRRPGRGRCLRVSLTDGRARFVGYEYGVVEALSGDGMRAGAKLALTDPYVDDEGRIWLENETCVALGGCVERLERARRRVLEVLEAPNRPGVVVGDRMAAAAKSAWGEERDARAATAATTAAARSREETRAVMDREPLAMNSLGSDGRGSDATPSTPKVVPVSLVPDSLGATELDENVPPPADARVDGGRASEPASSLGSGLERDSIPSMPNDVALAGRARDVARRLNETAVKGLWTYVAAVKSARAEGVDDKSTSATVHGWITRIGKIEVNEDASRGKMWRLKIQVSDSTGAANAFLRFAQLDAVAESNAAVYAAASAREKAAIEARARRRLEEFCGRIKLAGLKDRIMHVAKLDVQPTSFKSSVIAALDARVRELA